MSTYETLMLAWANQGQLDIQSKIRYEKLRTAGEITLLTDGATYKYALPDAAYAVDKLSFRTVTNPNLRPTTIDRIYRRWDKQWDDVGDVKFVALRPGYVWFWRIPSVAYATANPIVYYDYFTRFDSFATTSSALTQYYEQDRIVLLNYLIYRGYAEMDDTRENQARKDYEDSVVMMGGIGHDQGDSGLVQVGLGPYFDDDLEDEMEDDA
jgi:hypothetical protein